MGYKGENLFGKTVLVTGAAGFIGGALCRRLVQDGCSLTGVDNLRSGDWTRVPATVNLVERDISDINVEEWVSMLEDVDTVFHLAAEKYNSSKSTPSRLIAANVTATERLFRACAMAGVRRTVFTSSLYAYGSLGPDVMSETDRADPTTLYGASKLMGEGILRSTDREVGLSWNIARLFFIYGPRQFADGGYKSVILVNFERLLRGEAPVVNGSGGQTLDYVYVEDCVDALVSLATSSIDRQIVNVASGHGVSVRELTAQMCSLHGFDGSPDHAQADWTEGTMRVGDPTAIAQTFDWTSKTSIEGGLRKVYEWMRGSL